MGGRSFPAQNSMAVFMKLIQTQAAPNPRRVRVFLAEKGLVVPMEEMALTVDALKAPDFVALNPVRRVPILVLDDGTAISESMAICRYFEELHPEPALFGSGALERALVEMWVRRIENHLFFHIAQSFRHLHPGMKEREVPQVAAWGEANKAKIGEQLDIVNAALADRTYLASEGYSIADITLLVTIDFMARAQFERPGGLDHLERWYAMASSRPSAQA